ncbi:hypothetical protein KHP62_06150 [Rhodobacteraceae bacterium NNCM2]|nr:hypothetical protein [Coraliihabitans acroporae]
MPRLLASAAGRISHLGFFYSAEGAEFFEAAFRAAFSACRPETRLTILSHPSVRRRLDQLLADCGRSAAIVESPAEMSFSIWARDALVACEGRTCLIPQRFERYDDLAAARILAEAAGLTVTPSPHEIEGGNLLATGRALVVGADTLAPGEAASEQILQLAGGRRIVILGDGPLPSTETRIVEVDGEPWEEVIHFGRAATTRQPVFHIDIAVALAGEDIAIVGCPRLAFEMIGRDTPDHAAPEAFDAIAAQLAEAGFKICRCPLPLIQALEQDKRRWTWTFLPYPNVWVEEGRVWLPQFGDAHAPGLAQMDAVVAELWRCLGFTVMPVAGCLPLAQNLGALNCMGNVLEREPPQPQP